eukprot:Skav227531  [mRNA]  locus=scaffold3314:42573:43388:+ [translate_table: standard]
MLTRYKWLEARGDLEVVRDSKDIETKLRRVRRNVGDDVLLSAVKLGKILQEPLRISPNISLKKALHCMVCLCFLSPKLKEGITDGFLVGILPHDDLVRSGAKAAERS